MEDCYLQNRRRKSRKFTFFSREYGDDTREIEGKSRKMEDDSRKACDNSRKIIFKTRKLYTFFTRKYDEAGPSNGNVNEFMRYLSICNCEIAVESRENSRLVRENTIEFREKISDNRESEIMNRESPASKSER